MNFLFIKYYKPNNIFSRVFPVFGQLEFCVVCTWQPDTSQQPLFNTQMMKCKYFQINLWDYLNVQLWDHLSYNIS